MRLLLKYIQFHLKIIDRFFLSFLNKIAGNPVVFLANLRQIIFKSEKIIFHREDDFSGYVATSGDARRYFYEKSRNVRIYSQGLKSRAKQLGDDYFLTKIKFRSGDIIVDCGANLGDVKLWFDYNAQDVCYIGIEPSPMEYESLKRNVYPSKVYNAGLLDQSGEIDFYLSSGCADSSFIKPKQFSSIKKIPVYRLDELVNVPIRLLKLEAEGAEPEVIAGAVGILHKVDYISADLGFERGVSEDSTLVEVTNLLMSNGFTLVDFNRRLVALFRRNNLIELN